MGGVVVPILVLVLALGNNTCVFFCICRTTLLTLLGSLAPFPFATFCGQKRTWSERFLSMGHGFTFPALHALSNASAEECHRSLIPWVAWVVVPSVPLHTTTCDSGAVQPVITAPF